MAEQMQTRTESAARWEKSLARALAAGPEVFVVADTGERMVTSASQLDTLHRTDGTRTAAPRASPAIRSISTGRSCASCWGCYRSHPPRRRPWHFW
jgi:hypothetical protein